MSKIIISKILGPLQHDHDFFDWWKSEKIEIPFFKNERIAVSFVDFDAEYDLALVAEADRILEDFLKLNVRDQNLFSDQAYKCCAGFEDKSELNHHNNLRQALKDHDEIWNFIYPRNIYIVKPAYRGQGMYIQIVCKCSLEYERWIHLVFREGKGSIKLSRNKKFLNKIDTQSDPLRRIKRLCNQIINTLEKKVCSIILFK